MTTNVAAMNSANILPEQWNGFYATIEASHPDASYSQRQREFLARLMDAQGNVHRNARFALQMLRDEWCMLIPQNSTRDLVPFQAKSTEEKEEFLMEMRRELVQALHRRQATIGENGALNAQQRFFRQLTIHAYDLSLSFLLQVGMWLSFRFLPGSNSWHVAGKAYLLGQLCKLTFLAANPEANDELPAHLQDGDSNDSDSNNGDDSDGDSNDGDSNDSESNDGGSNEGDSNEEEEEEAEEVEEEEDNDDIHVVHLTKFVANDRDAGRLKSCVFATWYKNYEKGGGWNERLMLDAWLREGMREFRRITLKVYSAGCFPQIASTASNWIVNLSSLSKGIEEPVAPPGSWEDKMGAKFTGPERKPWLDYHAKWLADKKKSIPSTARKHSQADGASAAATSRKRTRESILNGPTADTSSSTFTTSGDGDLMSLLDRSQRADREWVTQFQNEARETETRRHNEVMAALQQSARQHEELMRGLQGMIGFLVPAQRSYGFPSPAPTPPPPPTQQYNYNGSSYSIVPNSTSARSNTN